MSSPTAPFPDTEALIARHDRALSPNYRRQPIAIERGEGAWLYDATGKAYLDLFAGFGAGLLGHAHPDLVEAVTEQAGKVWHVGNLLHTEPQVRLAEAVRDTGFGGLSFFCHSGADANEAAIKLARLYGRANPSGAGARHKVISATNSFHGRSYATMAATGQGKVSEGFEPLPAGFTHVPFDDVAALEEAIDAETVAVLLEPIQGEGGIILPSDDYLTQVRRLCDQHDLLLILDEVWTGGGRTGRMFAHQHFGVTPDMMTLAKGVGGGLPVGVMCARPALTEHVDASEHGVKHATTLGGNPLSMAAAARLFEVIQRDNLVAHADTLGRRALERLQQWASQHEAVTAVRGKGLFIGIEFDPTSDAAWFDSTLDLFKAGLDRGLLLNATHGNVVRLAPPITISQPELDEGLDRLERLIG